MKQALKEVLLDLLFFVKDLFSSSFRSPKKHVFNPPVEGAFVDISDISEPDQSVHRDELIEGQKMYVLENSVSCYLAPQRTFDSRIATCSYGEVVYFIRTEGDFSQVQTAAAVGWVLSSVLTDNPQLVFPNFESEKKYDAHSLETVRLRRCIKDEMMGGEMEMVLQSSEFVLYKLWREHITVFWDASAPRVAGAWQSLLRGKRGIQIGIEPRTKSIMECSGSGQRPFLGYVESVHPNHSIVLESIGRTVDGEYRTEKISQTDWKEWRPVFISIT